MWGLLSYFTLFDWLRQGQLFARTMDKRPYINDFVNTYSAAHLAVRCLSEHINVYDPKIQDDAVRKLVAPVVPENPFYFQYPPHYFMLAIPLSLVSMPVAWALWNIVWLGASIYGMWFVTREWPRKEAWTAIALALASFPFWMSVQLAQTSLLLFSLAIAFFELLRRRKYLWAGVVTGFVSIKLQYLPVFGIIGLIAGGLPFVGGAAATLAILFGGTVAVLGMDNIIRFPQALAAGETGAYFTGVNPFVMQNFRGQLWLLLHGEGTVSHYISAAVFALGVVAIGWLWWRERGRFGSESGLTPAVTIHVLAAQSILIALMTSVHTHNQDYVLATLPCMWMWWMLKDKQESWRERSCVRLIKATPALSWLYLLQVLFALILIQPFFLWAVVFLALIISPQQKHADGGSGD
jgi:hypothetical protein